MSSADKSSHKHSHPPHITTLFDLITALQEHREPDNDDEITSAIVQLCEAGYLQFLSPPENETSPRLGAA